MNIQEKKLENSRVEITVEVSADVIEQEFEHAFVRIQKSAKIDGFRPGKAPLAMIKTKYADRADQDVVENIVKDNYFFCGERAEPQPRCVSFFRFRKTDPADRISRSRRRLMSLPR